MITTSYGRLVFGLSVTDCIQSAAIIISPHAVPKDAPDTAWGKGNVYSCNFTGFLLTFASSAVSMYTCSLCIYYYCKLKMNMTDAVFYDRIEKKIHITIVFLNIVVSTAGVLTNSVNVVPNNDFCHYARKPLGCDRSSDCERGHHARLFTFLYNPILVPCLSLLCTIGSMITILWNVVNRERVFLSATTGKTSLRRMIERTKAFVIRSGSPSSDYNGQQPNETEAHFIARVYRREIMLQTLFYVSVYFLTYGIGFFISVLNALDMNPPLIIGLMFVIFYPMGGFFNLLIYTRPSIVAFRRGCPEHSWLKALLMVVRAGGANPNSSISGSSDQSAPSNFCCRRQVQEDIVVPVALRQIYARNGRDGEDQLNEHRHQGLVSSGMLKENDGDEKTSTTHLGAKGQTNKNTAEKEKEFESSGLSLSGYDKIDNSQMSSLTCAIVSDVPEEKKAFATDAFNRAFQRIENNKAVEPYISSSFDVKVAISSSYGLSGFSSVQDDRNKETNVKDADNVKETENDIEKGTSSLHRSDESSGISAASGYKPQDVASDAFKRAFARAGGIEDGNHKSEVAEDRKMPYSSVQDLSGFVSLQDDDSFHSSEMILRKKDVSQTEAADALKRAFGKARYMKDERNECERDYQSGSMQSSAKDLSGFSSIQDDESINAEEINANRAFATRGSFEKTPNRMECEKLKHNDDVKCGALYSDISSLQEIEDGDIVNYTTNKDDTDNVEKGYRRIYDIDRSTISEKKKSEFDSITTRKDPLNRSYYRADNGEACIGPKITGMTGMNKNKEAHEKKDDKKRKIAPEEEAASAAEGSEKIADAFKKAFARANKIDPRIPDLGTAKAQEPANTRNSDILFTDMRISSLVKYSELSTLMEGDGDDDADADED